MPKYGMEGTVYLAAKGEAEEKFTLDTGKQVGQGWAVVGAIVGGWLAGLLLGWVADWMAASLVGWRTGLLCLSSFTRG